MDQLLSGVDTVVAMGVADPNKICLYGHSNGGGVVNYAVTRTNRFKCAVSIAGALTDWTRIALLGYYPAMLAMFEGGDAVWDDPAGYVQLSAVYHLKAVMTPMLLADGDCDDDFLLDTIEMYNGLRYYGKDVTLLRYPDQGHVLQGPAMQDFWKRELAFFDKHLKVR
jgi:dipeptidyl aminopeptidase/acylaminoacyl peptidase